MTSGIILVMLFLAEPADCFWVTSSRKVTLNNARHVFLFRMLTKIPDSKYVQRGMCFACFWVFPSGQPTFDCFCSSSHSPAPPKGSGIHVPSPHPPPVSLSYQPLDCHTAVIWTWELGQKKNLQLLSISYRKKSPKFSTWWEFWASLTLSWLDLSANVLAFSWYLAPYPV